MERSLVVIQQDEPRISTWEMSKGFEVEHRVILKLVHKYKSEFETFGFITPAMQKIKKKKGRPIEDLMLNEPQATYLTTLLTNNEKVRKFKMKITRQFFEMRKQLMKLAIQRQNVEWISRREAGKIERRLGTDAIKDFIEYAKSQGSKNADKYYMSISNMENKSLVNLDLLQQEFPNMRDVIDVFTLSALQIADVIVATTLKSGMQLAMFYKDIYLLARDKVEGLALSIGKTPVRLMIKENQKTLTHVGEN